MNALETHQEKMQEDAAALQAIAHTVRTLATRDEEDVRDLLTDLAEKALGLSRDLNIGLDIVNLPKGGL